MVAELEKRGEGGKESTYRLSQSGSDQARPSRRSENQSNVLESNLYS